MNLPDPATPSPDVREVRYEYTPNLPEILKNLKASLLVTTYQAGKLLVLGEHDNRLQISFCNFEQAMGVAVSPQTIAVGSRRQIHFLVAAHECAPTIAPLGVYDSCFVPRSTHCTGSIHGHDLAWGSEGLWIVNTLFSCLCTLHDGYNFVPRWRPKCITQLIDQDRCHLNGLAMEHGRPRYVTVLAESDEPAGWRARKESTGAVIDVDSHEVLARGFAMPHSPRLHLGQLWLLDSGTGRVGIVDRRSGQFSEVELVPGYPRGLALHGQFAFVGLSKIRETAVFGGLPITQKFDELRCGVAVIDVKIGRTVSVFQFHSGVDEIYAVELLAGMPNPMVASSAVDMHERDVWIVPDPKMPAPQVAPGLPVYARGAPASPPMPLEDSLVGQAPTLQRAGQLEEASRCLLQAIQRTASPAPLWVDLGNLRQDQGNQEAAVDCYRRALEVDPQCIAARQNLGYLLFNRGEPEQAAAEYEALLKLAPTAINRLLNSSVLPVVYDSSDDVFRWRDRVQKRLQEMVARGDRVDARHQQIPTFFFLAYQGENDRPLMELRAQVVDGDLTYESSSACSAPDSGTRSATQRRRPKLRVGFLSAYFRDHTIGRLNIGRVERLDRQQFEVVVASPTRADDPLANRFRQAADHYQELPRDVAAARRALRELNLDVLLFADVGMDALTSTLAFSRMAPTQIVTWGHPITTASPAMDYFLSSELLEVEDAQAHYTESLLRMPLLGTYYERPELDDSRLDRRDFGWLDGDHVYLCPQTLFKMHPDFDVVLRGILEQDPSARIALISGRCEAWTQRLEARWRRTLPEHASRWQFLSPMPRDDFLRMLQLADLMIDPLHFGGGNSSYEALAMGLPIVTLPGQFLRSRITQALYRKMQLCDFIATDADDFVQRSVGYARDEAVHGPTRTRIQGQAGCLFEDPEEVHCLEDTLQRAVGAR